MIDNQNNVSHKNNESIFLTIFEWLVFVVFITSAWYLRPNVIESPPVLSFVLIGLALIVCPNVSTIICNFFFPDNPPSSLAKIYSFLHMTPRRARIFGCLYLFAAAVFWLFNMLKI